MKCDGCKYHGIILEHLAGFQDFAEWRSCDYPLPYYGIPQAVPTGIEHKCRVYSPNQSLDPDDKKPPQA